MAVAVLAGVCLLALGAAELKIPPSPDRWVTDTAGFLSPTTAQELDRTLEAYEKQSGHQVIVYIGKTTDGYPVEDFATRAFQAWKVGRKGLDDGLVLFIMAEDRKIRIEVGYGLEPVVPDIIAGRIINDVMVPKIRAGDNDGAVREAVAAIVQTISGQAPGAAPGEQQPESPAPGFKGKRTVQTIFIIIAAIFFLILFITHPSLALWLLFNIMSGGRGGGGFGGGGGGGFRGGGGRSGGGGASGGW